MVMEEVRIGAQHLFPQKKGKEMASVFSGIEAFVLSKRGVNSYIENLQPVIFKNIVVERLVAVDFSIGIC